MSKPHTLMTSLDASVFDSDAENDVALAFEEDTATPPVNARKAGDDRDGGRAVFSTALRTLLVSTTYHKP
ncbi:MAG: hypothetical protein RLW62_00210 [Gammaproteobacteria bacterium]